MRVFKGLLFFVALPICVGFAVQTEMLSRPQAASAPSAFDVVSIKLDQIGLVPGVSVGVGCHGLDGSAPPWRVIPMGTCIASRATAEMLLMAAYDVGFALNVPLKGSIAGEPAWFTQDNYAVQAKSENPPSLADLRKMLQTMLAERFKLQCHIETKEFDGFALVVGKNGPKLQATSLPAEGPGAPPTNLLQPASGEEANPGVELGFRGVIRGGVGPATTTGNSLRLVNVPMDYVARALSNDRHKPAVNNTGLAGNYNLTTQLFAPPESMDSPNPSLVTIIEEFGLKLEARKVQVPVLVIDHVEKPTID